ncbi:MAG: peptidoglycan-binding domain-containing protein [Actinomycetota bacterium]
MTGVGAKRQRTLALVVVAAVVAAGLGFMAGRSITSPADAGADAEAPEPSLITVPVELRELASNVVTRGDARREGSVQVSVDASAGASSGGVAVVTGVTAPQGAVVEEGSVLVEVSERPVIALQGQLPMVRSLGPGSRGDDVAQLQEALVRVGIEVPVDGFFGEETERGVEQLYVQVGYSAPGLTEDERVQLDAARESLDGAQASLNAASAALAELQSPLPESQRLQADASLASAEDAVDLAEATATEANAVAEADLAARRVERTDAQDAADLAADRLAQAEGGTHPDTGLAPTVEELAILTAEDAAAAEVLVSASAAVTAAEATVARTSTEQAEFVDSSKSQLEIAQAQYDELLAPPDTRSASQSVADARRARDRALVEVDEIEARTGVRVPLAEVVFIEAMPTQVQRIDVERGDIIGGAPIMTVSGADVTVEAALAGSDRPLVAEGDRVLLDDQSLGIEVDGTIAFLADEDGGLAPDGRFFMRITLDETPETDIAGLNLRITIPITSTGGEVLTVPLAALAAGGDGSVRVEVEDPGNPGDTRTVIVTTGLETTGFVEVTPVDGDLVAGDRVVVGQQ